LRFKHDAFDPNLLRGLLALTRQLSDGLAETLRAHLAAAGVTRADLHTDLPGSKRVTCYDLRATGITWEVLGGTEHVRMMQRAGREQFETTMGYIREADAVGLNAGEPFPQLT
jgi:hypothetical protein